MPCFCQIISLAKTTLLSLWGGLFLIGTVIFPHPERMVFDDIIPEQSLTT